MKQDCSAKGIHKSVGHKRSAVMRGAKQKEKVSGTRASRKGRPSRGGGDGRTTPKAAFKTKKVRGNGEHTRVQQVNGVTTSKSRNDGPPAEERRKVETLRAPGKLSTTPKNSSPEGFSGKKQK